VLFVGDYAPGSSPADIHLDMRPRGLMLNLEGPVVDSSKFSPIRKSGPHLASQHLPLLAREVPSVFNLANNHFMDFGPRAAEETLQLLEEFGIRFVGFGVDGKQAQEGVVIDTGGVRVGILASAERQFGLAGINAAGVAGFGPWVYSAIREMRNRADFIVVSCDGGNEDLPWPSPERAQLYRSLIDAGADFVYGHHSHRIQGLEEHAGGIIAYGLGNFAVPPGKWSGYSGGLLSMGVEITSFRPLRWSTRLMLSSSKNNRIVVCEVSNQAFDNWSTYWELLTDPLRDPEQLQAIWQLNAERLYTTYGQSFMGWGLRGVWRSCKNRLRDALALGSWSRGVSRNDLDRFHMVSCDSHQQVLETALSLRAQIQKVEHRTDAIGVISRLESEQTRIDAIATNWRCNHADSFSRL